MNEFVNIFDQYTQKFLNNKGNSEIAANINLKIRHSKNVFRNALEISEHEKLSDYDRKIAGISGLFHDIGRFEQFTKYNTFRDENGIYHGQLGVDVLKNTRMLGSVETESREIIYNAIYDHGLKSIPTERSGKQLFFSKLVRDADKTDIFRIVAEYYHKTGARNIALEYGLDNSKGISQNVLEVFYEQKSIDKNDLKTLDDFKCMQIAWIFDINFEFTYSKIINSKYIEAIVKSLKDQKQAVLIQEELKNYIFAN